MGLGVTSEEVWAEPVLAEVLGFAARSFKVRWRLLRHNQTANKTVNKNNSAFKGYVPKRLLKQSGSRRRPAATGLRLSKEHGQRGGRASQIGVVLPAGRQR